MEILKKQRFVSHTNNHEMRKKHTKPLNTKNLLLTPIKKKLRKRKKSQKSSFSILILYFYVIFLYILLRISKKQGITLF